MPSTYQLFPGLKQILEDKRIRKFGLPKDEYNNYLMAEQFVVDMRPISEYETRKQMLETYDDLNELSLGSPPFDNFIIHTIEEDKSGKIVIISYYFSKGNLDGDMRNIILLFESDFAYQSAYQRHEELKDVLSERSRWAMVFLVVMLSTTGIIKNRIECKKSQMPSNNGWPHKKGSGGYTIIRAPEAHELTGGHSGAIVRPHFRRGHIRKLHPEDKARWVWVRPCFIHGEPEVQRKAYLVA